MTSMEEFLDVMERLHGKDGCPWDSIQTISSLKPCLIEEAAEVLCGIDLYEKTGDMSNLREELGDLLMVISLECIIAEERGLFTFDEVAQSARQKMIRRHPNVFSKAGNMNLDEQKKLWDEIKREEKKNKNPMVDELLPDAFEEARTLIERAEKRKGYK